MTVAIVILNWNGFAHLRTYLPSVVQHSSGARIIVADNGSTDNSREALTPFPAVEWLSLDRNYGFTGGYNRALAQVEADVYVLLNSDVRVTAGWLQAPLSRLRHHGEVAAVQPKILADARPTQFEYAGACGGYLDALGYPYCRGRIFDQVEQDHGQYDDARPIDWASGACCFVRASSWHELGGFDESFFAHMEEIDLCWRMRRAGHEVWVEPGSTVHHLGGGTLAYASPNKTYLNFRNSLASLVRNETGLTRWLKLLARLALDGLAGLKFLVAGEPSHTWAILRAHGAFYGRLSAVLQHRHVPQIQGKATSCGPVKSILWQFYVRGQKTFSHLTREK